MNLASEIPAFAILLPPIISLPGAATPPQLVHYAPLLHHLGGCQRHRQFICVTSPPNLTVVSAPTLFNSLRCYRRHRAERPSALPLSLILDRIGYRGVYVGVRVRVDAHLALLLPL